MSKKPLVLNAAMNKQMLVNVKYRLVEGTMKGIDFLLDANGNKKAIVIDLDIYGEIFEDFWDGVVAESRINEESIELSELIMKLG